MNVETIMVGNLQTNCYLLQKENEVMIIDPGDEYKKIKEKIGNQKVVAIAITHYHEDHIGALAKLKRIYQVPVYDFHQSSQKIKVGPFSFQILPMKGHSEDSVIFYFAQEETMFVGDFLFYHSVGRCDLPTGNFVEMKNSIERIKKYPNVLCYPGHGIETTLEEERKNNPYF